MCIVIYNEYDPKFIATDRWAEIEIGYEYISANRSLSKLVYITIYYTSSRRIMGSVDVFGGNYKLQDAVVASCGFDTTFPSVTHPILPNSEVEPDWEPGGTRCPFFCSILPACCNNMCRTT